jgi:ABC-type branched-subunit amino acid transport system ATPase component
VFHELTLIENLAVAIQQPWWALLRQGVGPADRARAEEVLGEFGLTELAGNKARELSFGQQKLLEFATVLMGRPKLVLLDEPTAGVNPVMIDAMERRIRDLHRQGITFLIVEHEMSLVMRLCDPVIVLDHGTKLAEGPPADVRKNPVVLDAYLGA